MFRLSLRNLSRSTLRVVSSPINTRIALANQFKLQPLRFQSTSSLTKEDVFARSIAILNSFELKNPSEKIELKTEFIKDLGMDSLDYNDALVALEEEFDVIFDDKSANDIKSVGECVDYILANYLPTQETLDHDIR